MIIGYARVSKKDQNLQMQIDALNQKGVERIYEEKITGIRSDREQLNEALKIIRNGDTFVVWKLDRLGRTAKQLIDLVEDFQKNGINFISVQENIDTTTALGRFMFNMLCAIAQMERDVIVERTMRGLESARARGRVGGRPPVSNDKIKAALTMYDSCNHSIDEILQATGISKKTLYNYIDKRKSASATQESQPVSKQEHEDIIIAEPMLPNFSRKIFG